MQSLSPGVYDKDAETVSEDSCQASCPQSPPRWTPLVGSPSLPSWLRTLPWSYGWTFFKQLPWLMVVVVGGAAGTEQLPTLPTFASSGEKQMPCLLVLSWGCIWKEFSATWPLCSPGGGGPGQWVGEKRGGPLPSWRPTCPSTHPLGAGCPFPLPSPAAAAFLA